MNIVSDFTDYYDVCMEKDNYWCSHITYLRQSKQIDANKRYEIINKLGDYASDVKLFDSYMNKEWLVNCFIVGCSGDLYKGIRLYNKGKVRVSYTFSGVLYLSKQIDLELPSHILEYSKNYFENYSKSDDEIFHKLKTPIFLIEQTTVKTLNITVNPCLIDYDFFKVASSNKIYNSIQRYIDEQLEPLPRMSCYQAIPHRVYGKEWSSWEPNFTIGDF